MRLLITALLLLGAPLYPAHASDWWAIGHTVAPIGAIIKLADAGSIEEREGITTMRTMTLLAESTSSPTGGKFDYMLGFQAINCKTKEYRDVSVQPFSADGKAVARALPGPAAQWTKAPLGSTVALTMSAACTSPDEWKDLGFERVSIPIILNARRMLRAKSKID